MRHIYQPTGIVKTDAEFAVKALKRQQETMAVWRDYYEGRQPLNYISRAMQQLLDARGANNYDYVQNYCSLVVDAYYDRLEIERVEVLDNEALETAANDWISDPDTTIEVEEINRAALIYPTGYAMVFPDPDGQPELRAQDPLNTVVFSSPADSRQYTLAAKQWEGTDGDQRGTRLNLYYPERVVKLFRPTGTQGIASRPFEPVRSEEADVPYGTWIGVPIVPVQTRRPVGASIFADIISGQNRINQLSAAKLIAQEFGILPQRYIVTEATLDEGALRSGPNTIWPLPPGSSAGQFPAMDLASFDTAIDREIERIVASKRLPRWYVQMQGGDPSGEALKTSEAGMVKHVRELQLYLGASLREVLDLYARMSGAQGARFNLIWESPESQAISADIMQFDSFVKAGMPMDTALRVVYDWNDDQFAQMNEDRMAQQAQQGNVGSLLLQQFNSGSTVGP